MNKLYKILFFAVLLTFSGVTCFSQSVFVPADTLKSVQKKTDLKENAQNQENKGSQGNVKSQSNNRNAAGSRPVKKVNSARPDMSKARGARPNIVRPSGSGMPKGAGKPGGVGHLKGR